MNRNVPAAGALGLDSQADEPQEDVFAAQWAGVRFTSGAEMDDNCVATTGSLLSNKTTLAKVES